MKRFAFLDNDDWKEITQVLKIVGTGLAIGSLIGTGLGIILAVSNNFLSISLLNWFLIASFILALFIDYLIVNNLLKFVNKEYYIIFRNMFYPYIDTVLFLIIFIIFYLIFSPYFYFEWNFNKFYHTVLYMSGKEIEISVGTDATIDINNPNINTSVSKEGINSMAAALFSAGGATAGLKVAQYVSGSPAV